MITVDCRDVEAIKNELLVYVSDQIAAIPAIKNHEFVLSPINDGEIIETTEVITIIKEFLESERPMRVSGAGVEKDLSFLASKFKFKHKIIGICT